MLFVAAWSAATFGGFVSRLPRRPADDARRRLGRWDHGFALDIGMMIWRVLGVFVLAALAGSAARHRDGRHKPVEAFFEPFVSFARYLPASAFIRS